MSSSINAQLGGIEAALRSLFINDAESVVSDSRRGRVLSESSDFSASNFNRTPSFGDIIDAKVEFDDTLSDEAGVEEEEDDDETF